MFQQRRSNHRKTLVLGALAALIIGGICFLQGDRHAPLAPPDDAHQTTAAGNPDGRQSTAVPSPEKSIRSGKPTAAAARKSIIETPGTLRRGANRRLLVEPAVVTGRNADPCAISPESLFSLSSHSPTGPLTIDQHTLSAVEASVDFEALATFVASTDGAISLPVSANEQVVATFDRVITRGATTTTLIGRVLDDSYSDVLLVFHDGAVSGSIAFHDTNTHYQFAMAGNGDVAIRQLDPDSFDADCACCEHPEILASDTSASDTDESAGETIDGEILRATVDDAPFDIVVGYSAEARINDGGTAAIEARIIASVDRLNQAIDNSGGGDWFCSLLAMIEDPDEDFTDADYSDMEDILIDLRQTDNGPLDTITDLQLELGADQATFICDAPIAGTTGIAGRPGTSAVVSRTYMSSTRLTFAHELGHNLGLRHAWGDSGSATLNPTDEGNYGWRFRTSDNSKVYTIMAYNSGWGGSRIPYFSNPGISYNGAATGAVDGFDATDTSSTPAYDQQLVAGGIVGDLGAGFDGSNPNLGARNGPYLRYNSGLLANKDTREDLAVLEPVAGAILVPGTTTTIYWYGGDHTDTVDLDLYKDGVFHSSIATNLEGQNRWHDWTVPNVEEGTYTVRATLSGSTTDDSSEFWIGIPVETLPYAEGFENGFGSWVQSADDDFDWTRHSGGTDTGSTGPSAASEGSWYLYTEPHDNYDGHNKVAQIDCKFDLSTVSSAALEFDYHMYGANIDYLAVDVFDGSAWTNDVWKLAGPVQSSSEDAWLNATVDLADYAGIGEITVRFRAKQKYWHVSDIAIDNIVVDGTQKLPYAESFENGMGAWAQSTDDDYDWTLNSGGTESPAAGPSGASAGSYYLYAEGHHGLGSNKTASVTARFDLSRASAPVFRFDYHMYGTYIDYLSVDVHDGTTWTDGVWFMDGQQQTSSDDPWGSAAIDLSAYAGNGDVTLRFRTANTQWNSADPAIDNLRLSDPLLAHWSMDGGTGSVVADDEGNGFDATHTGASWVAGINGTALEFDGSNSTVTLPASAFDTVVDEITLAMWVYGGDDQPRQDSLFYAVNASGNRVLNAHLPWGDGTVYWDAGYDESTDRISKAATTDEIKGRWNHWTFTKNAATGGMSIYLNGELWHEDSGMTRRISGITAATLGSQISGKNYSGIIDNVRLYNVCLDADGAAALFSSYTTADGVPLGWLIEHGLDPTDAAALADADSDGQSNALEWILGTDPLVPDSPVTGLSAAEDIMNLTYTRRKVDGTGIHAEWSPDLTESSWTTAGLTESVINDDGEIETVTVAVPMTHDRKFVRIRVDW